MKILVVDDERKMATLVAGALEDEGYDVAIARDGREAIAAIDESSIDLVVTDLRMPPPDGMAVLAHCRALAVPPEVVMMTAHGSVSNAVAAMRAGAYDYLTKPFELDEVVALAARVADLIDTRRETHALRAENARLVEKLGDAGAAFDGIIGESEVMREVFALARKVADSDATVLIRGESGTGKGRIARAIHAASPRNSRPFVKINCGALPETLLESELFGHEKGAFTGAVKQKPGRFELAEGGTVFLDEIGEISPAVQVKLLQVLEEKRFVRVGGTETLTCDVRLLAATHRDLERMIPAGEFRQDLFYRLNVFPIEMPPLRVRGNDRALLVRRYLESRGREPEAIDREAMRLLLGYDFPGNVRELENLLERAIILAGDRGITRADFPSLAPTGSAPPPALEIPEEGLSLDEVERRLIEQAIEKAGGNKSQAARLLGVTRRTLYSRMEKHGMGPPASAGGEEGPEG
jgi:DNA-binding NtrC family response regulator